jgi:hypothetical protein
VTQDIVEPIKKLERLDGSLELGEAPSPRYRLSQNPYEPVDEWGRDGYDVGSPPEYTLFASEGPDGYGLGFNIEGDWREEIYADRESRDAAIDAAVFEDWKKDGEEWVEVIETIDDLPADLRGPFSVGPVPAHRHINPDGSTGGWVAETAYVAPTAFLAEHAYVYDRARVTDKA